MLKGVVFIGALQVVPGSESPDFIKRRALEPRSPLSTSSHASTGSWAELLDCQPGCSPEGWEPAARTPAQQKKYLDESSDHLLSPETVEPVLVGANHRPDKLVQFPISSKSRIVIIDQFSDRPQ